MVCRHLEQLAMDIKHQGIAENSSSQNGIEGGHESVYFDCHLDRKSIRQKHNFPDFVTDYTIPETDSAQGEGLICNQCNQAIIGLHKGYMPGSKTFGYNDAGQAHVFSFEDSNATEDMKNQGDANKEKKKRQGIGSIIFAVLLGVPIALYQYLPNNMKLGFVAGICALILVPLILSPVAQKIRGKDRYSFPFANIFIMLLIGLPVFILYGWQPIYYLLAGYAVLLFFGSVIRRLLKSKS